MEEKALSDLALKTTLLEEMKLKHASRSLELTQELSTKNFMLL